MSGQWQTVIGLEVHAQLATNTKMWCGCAVDSRAEENTRVCEVCSGQPGSLPVLNKQAVHYALQLALATHCHVNNHSHFDRKNYFYPDLPKGYQISQFEKTLATDGKIMMEDDEGQEKTVGIERIQLEEDTGKSLHVGQESLINLNRCGTPLVEVVGRPQLTSPTEASRYLKSLHSIMTYLGICHGNLQEGNFRTDVNISLKKKEDKEFGRRTEIKNLNSFRFVEKAIEAEVKRQRDILDSGQAVIQQTLNFDVTTQSLKVLRTKSDAHDYRYFSEPDLLPLVITAKEVEEVEKALPELPRQKMVRFVEQYNLPRDDAKGLTGSIDMANYFEKAVKNFKGKASKKVANWIRVELLRLINQAQSDISRSPVSAGALAELLNEVESGSISGKMAKDVFEKMFDTGKGAKVIIQELGLAQVSDQGELAALVEKVILDNPKEVERFQAGEKKLMGFFVGQVMKASQGKANPKLVNDLIKEKLP